MERYGWVDSQVPVSTQGSVVEAQLSGGPIRDVLVVDPSLELQRTVKNVVRSMATVDGCSTFEAARRRIISCPPDLLVTTVRLHAHNGLHLVYLATRNPRTRCIVHLTAEDFALARDAEAAGAFVVREPSLEVAIESLVCGHTAPMRSQSPAGN
jgi:DNA-binding NtrC family response regulator